MQFRQAEIKAIFAAAFFRPIIHARRRQHGCEQDGAGHQPRIFHADAHRNFPALAADRIMHGNRAEIRSRLQKAANRRLDALQAARFDDGLRLRQFHGNRAEIHDVAAVHLPKRACHKLEPGVFDAADFPNDHLNRAIRRADGYPFSQHDFFRFDGDLQLRWQDALRRAQPRHAAAYRKNDHKNAFNFHEIFLTQKPQTTQTTQEMRKLIFHESRL